MSLQGFSFQIPYGGVKQYVLVSLPDCHSHRGNNSGVYCHRGGSASQNTILTSVTAAAPPNGPPGSTAGGTDTGGGGGGNGSGGGMCRGTSTNTFIDTNQGRFLARLLKRNIFCKSSREASLSSAVLVGS